MCLAIPGKIIAIEGKKAQVAYPNQVRSALLSGTDFSVGDFVMVQMGIVVGKLDAKQAKTALKAWKKTT